MAAAVGARRILRVREGRPRARGAPPPNAPHHAQEGRPARRCVGIVHAQSGQTGMGKIRCEEVGGDVTVSETELVGFEIGDIVSFALASDAHLDEQVATVLEAEDEQALERFRVQNSTESQVVDAVMANDEATLRAAVDAARKCANFDATTLWLGEAKLRMLCATRELRATQELVHALELTGTVAMEDQLRLQRALHEVKAACAEADAAADSMSFRDAALCPDDVDDSDDGEVEVVSTDPYIPQSQSEATEDEETRMRELCEELESVRTEKRAAAAEEDFARAARLRRRELELESELRKDGNTHKDVEVLESAASHKRPAAAQQDLSRTSKLRRRLLMLEHQRDQEGDMEDVQLVEVISRSPER